MAQKPSKETLQNSLRHSCLNLGTSLFKFLNVIISVPSLCSDWDCLKIYSIYIAVSLDLVGTVLFLSYCFFWNL